MRSHDAPHFLFMLIRSDFFNASEMSIVNQVLFFSLIPVATMVTGGIIAIVKQPGGNVRSLILHFAAGVVFSVVAVEILPDIIKNHLPVMTIIGFTLGFLAMM